MLKQYAFLSCAKICVDDSRFSPDLHKDRRVTVNKKQKSEISDSTAYITVTHQTMWSLLTNTIPHGRTNMYMVSPATEASMMAVGHFAKIFDPWKNVLQLTDDSVTKLKNELAENDPNVFFSYVPFSDDDTERPAEVRSLETFLLQDMDANDKVIIIADTRHTWRCLNVRSIPRCSKEIQLSSVIAQRHCKTWVSGHTSVLLAIHEMWMIWKQSNLPTFSERSLKINI